MLPGDGWPWTMSHLSLLMLTSYEVSHYAQPFIYLFFQTGSVCVAQVGLELSILWPQSPKCWDYRHALLCQAWLGG
jgi:hypothetical protein